jgi:hypothetical protein
LAAALRRSTTTISLPTPFIFTKVWLASAPIDFCRNCACLGFARFIWRIDADWPEAVLE